MFKRQTTGSVVCPSCGQLVGVNDPVCMNCGRRSPGMWGYAALLRNLGRDLGFVPMVMGGCIVLYLFQLILQPSSISGLLSPGTCASVSLGASGGVPVHDLGHWWSVLSAGWLHGNLIHIGFNLMWVRQLGPYVAEAYGPSRSAILYIVSGATGFAATSGIRILVALTGLPMPNVFSGALITLGASAAIFGWLAALIYFGRRSGHAGLQKQLIFGAALPLFIFGFLFPGVDNWAHAGGFGGGYALAMLLDPLKPERLNHTAIALLLIGLSALAVVASFLSGIPADFRPLLGCQ